MIDKRRAIRITALCTFVALAIGVGATTFYFRNFGQTGKIYGIMSLLQKTYYKDVDVSKMAEGAARGVVASLGDPYTVYMSKKEWEEFRIRTSGEYSGVGITIGVKDSRVQVISVIKGAPAERAGIKPNDTIVQVDGKPVTSSDEAATLIRGPAGTKVTLTVQRDDQTFNVTLEREEISIPAVAYKMAESGIGYIELTSFNEHSAAEFSKAVEDLKKQGVKSIILDLRNNGGGSLDQCIRIADLIVAEGRIVSMKGKNYPERTYDAQGPGLGIPLFVLVNENTASASEILAGAIQDRKAGTVIGTTTFGKGLVQATYELGDGDVVKVTIAEYLTPNGRAINGKGLEPDMKVEGEEAQLQKAMELARKEAQK